MMNNWKELVSITAVLITLQVGTVTVLKADMNKRMDAMKEFILEYVSKTEIRDCTQEKDIIRLQCKDDK